MNQQDSKKSPVNTTGSMRTVDTIMRKKKSERLETLIFMKDNLLIEIWNKLYTRGLFWT